MKFKIILNSCIFFLLFNCTSDKKNQIVKENQKEVFSENLNIIITPDLSNRVKKYPKPVSDIDLITNIFDNYYPTLYNYKNRVSGQKDLINLLFTNSNIIKEYNYDGIFSLSINQKENQNHSYLKTFDGTETDFKKDSRKFINNLDKVYKQVSINPAGADIFKFIKDKLNTVIQKEKTVLVQDYIVTTSYRNILVLFTDGYIEAGMSGSANCINNKCYFLDGVVIDKFRKDYKSNGKGLSLKAFFQEKGYGIIPIENEDLKNVEIFVCELFDRSLNAKTGSQRKIPNDYDIMKVFWEDWLDKSGVKKRKIYPKVDSVDDFNKNLMSFINEK
jgi:hypothetical protein